MSDREEPQPIRGTFPLADLVSALDLLDQLVDPLLEIGVCKSRVSRWKQMMREQVGEHYRRQQSQPALYLSDDELTQMRAVIKEQTAQFQASVAEQEKTRGEQIVDHIVALLGDASQGTVSPQRARNLAISAVQLACDNREGK